MEESPQAGEAPGSNGTEPSLRAMEMKYMELLEKRIADLEAKLKEAEKDEKKKDDEDKVKTSMHIGVF